MRDTLFILSIAVFVCCSCAPRFTFKEYRPGALGESAVVKPRGYPATYNSGILANRGIYYAFALENENEWAVVLYPTNLLTPKAREYHSQAWLVKDRFQYSHHMALQNGLPMESAERLDGRLNLKWRDNQHFRIEMDLIGSQSGTVVRGEFRSYTKPAPRTISVPSEITKIVIIEPSDKTNRIFTARSDIDPILAFISARTNDWHGMRGLPEIGIIEAQFFRGDKCVANFGVSYNRINRGWWHVRKLKRQEVKEFFSLLGEDYRKYWPNWD